MRSRSAVSPSTLNTSSSTQSQLSDEHIAVIAVAADSMAKALPPYAPKPLNMKRQIDKEIQVSQLVHFLTPRRGSMPSEKVNNFPPGGTLGSVSLELCR